MLEFYAENGPTGFCRYRLRTSENDFGVEGYLVMLVGNRAPYHARHVSTESERGAWERHRARFNATAKNAVDVKETLAYIRHPGWAWHSDRAATGSAVTASQGH